ncbi:MAG: hypothetical protein KA375_09520, partial [Vitreoscilla sp.]|nr:hypothetical protein [Vitreoscilla sp.]
ANVASYAAHPDGEHRGESSRSGDRHSMSQTRLPAWRGRTQSKKTWIPACAGMTVLRRTARHGAQTTLGL